MPTRPLCVFCRRREMDDRFRPFCGERCKMADLGRWLNGDYHVPGPPASEPAQTDTDLASLDDLFEDDAGSRR